MVLVSDIRSEVVVGVKGEVEVDAWAASVISESTTKLDIILCIRNIPRHLHHLIALTLGRNSPMLLGGSLSCVFLVCQLSGGSTSIKRMSLRREAKLGKGQQTD
jgi:hypothetical protein